MSKPVITRPAATGVWTFSAPWAERGRRFSPLKAACFALLLAPGIVVAVEWASIGLGGRPVTEAIHQMGLWMIRLLLLSLAVSPARAILDWPRVLLLRRMIGLAALAYGLAHFGLYIIDQDGRLLHVVSEIIHRIYLTIGFIALLGLAVLGATSTDGWMRRLRRRWRRLHQIVYGILVLGIVHYFMQSKSDVTDAVLLGGFGLWLLFWRALPSMWQTRWWALLLLAPISALATAGIEAAWYGIATGIDPWMVLQANLDVSFGLRPALWVGIVALCVALAGILRQFGQRLLRRRKTQRARA